MPRFKLSDLPSLEKSPTSPISLRNKIGEMLINSSHAVAKVEVVGSAVSHRAGLSLARRFPIPKEGSSIDE